MALLPDNGSASMSRLFHVPWGHEAGTTLNASQPFSGRTVLIFIKCEDWISHYKVVAE